MQNVDNKQRNSKIISNEIIDIVVGIKKTKKISKIINDQEIIDCRCDIIDWLVTVSKNMKLKPSTYYIAVETLDLFLEESINSKNLTQNDYLVIGVVCLLLATKLIEVEFIELDLVVNTLCNNYVSKYELIKVEENILYTLNFKVRTSFFEDFTYYILLLFDEEARSKSNGKLSKKYEKLFDINIFVLKILYQNYNFYRVKEKITLYFAILNFTFHNKLRTKDPVEFDLFIQFYKLAETFNVKVKSIERYSEEIKEEYLNFVKNGGKNENYLYSEEYLNLII